MKPTGKKYHIKTLDQLVNVATRENYEDLSKDFLMWLFMIIQSFDRMREKHPELKDKTNSQIAKVEFVWTDDGLNKINAIQVKNTATGEVSETKVNFDFPYDL